MDAEMQPTDQPRTIELKEIISDLSDVLYIRPKPSATKKKHVEWTVMAFRSITGLDGDEKDYDASEKWIMNKTKKDILIIQDAAVKRIEKIMKEADTEIKNAELEQRLIDLFPFLQSYGPIEDRKITTREGWLERASELMMPWIIGAAEAEKAQRTILIENGAKLRLYDLKHPPSGFDVAVAPIEKASRGCVGVCRHPSFHGGRARIQIAPILSGEEDSWMDQTYICHVLLHEMVHAFTEGHGHRGAFMAIMKRLNSAGKMTSSSAGDVQAYAIRTQVLPHLPDYTTLHVPFSIPKRGKRGVGSRMVKIFCPDESCGIIMRASGKVCESIHMQPCPACEESPLHVEGWQ